MYKLLFLLAFIFFSCKKNKSTEQEILNKQYTENNNPVKKGNAKLLNEVEFCKQVSITIKVEKTEKGRVIKFEDVKLMTPLDQDNANLFWKDSEPYTTNYPYGHLDYEFNEEEKGFMFFKCNKEYSLLFLEVHTEEFPTFQKIKLNNINDKVTILGDFTISLDNFEKINKVKQKEALFYVTNINNEDVLVSKNDKGDILGVYNKEIIAKTIKGSIVYAQVETYLNIRSSPDANASIIGKAYPKDSLKVLEIFENWVKIELNGKQGYVSSDFVK